MPVPTDLQSAQLWPIYAKGAIIRHSPAGDPQIENVYHQSLEDGRFLERTIGDANIWLAEKKADLSQKVLMYTRMNSLAVDGQLTHAPRVFKLAADSLTLLKDVSQIQREISALISAVTSNIGLFISMEQNLLGLVQGSSNALANLLNSVCNWGLPNLTSLANLLPEGLFNWNGFNFTPLSVYAAFAKPKFGFNFSFSQCALINEFVNPVIPQAPTISTYGGVVIGTIIYTPPLGGSVPPSGTDISNPAYQAQLEANTTAPVFGPTFNPNDSMIGSLPNPSTIISNYALPPAVYAANILSLIPATRDQVIEPTDADYAQPDIQTRQAIESKSLAHNVTLTDVVNSKFDPYVTSAWLLYLGLTRSGRGGLWLPNFEAVYQAHIQPSLDSLSTNSVPFNNFSGTVVDTPTDIPLVDVFNDLSSPLLENLLWKLSYIEAALLGYPRTKTWDDGSDTLYVSSFSGTDLDYATTPLSVELSSVVLGQGTAQFPVPVQFPTSVSTNFNVVVAQATEDILAKTSYQSPNPQSRFTFDQFANAVMVDRFSQFWRDFSLNLKILVAQDPYLVGQVFSYGEILDGALNPLGDRATYELLQTDAQTRNRAWIRGTPMLNLPVAPVVVTSNNTIPDPNNNGWEGVEFNAQAFLARPDVQAQPIPVQLAMLRTNLSYAALLQYSQAAQQAITDALTTANATLASAQQLGFHVTVYTTVTSVPVGPSGVVVKFDPIQPPDDFDLTGNVTNTTTFTLQAGGEYALFGQINWNEDPGHGAGDYIVIVTQNGTPIFSSETGATTGPFSQQFSAQAGFDQGDVVQVIVSSNLIDAPQSVLPGSFFSMLQISPTIDPPTPSGDTTTTTTSTFTAGSNFAALSALAVQSDGSVKPVAAPTIPNVTVITTDVGAPNSIIAPFIDGVSTAAGVTGQSVQVATSYGGSFQVTGASFTVGGLFYVKPDGTLTQDYDGLLNGTYGTLAWVICVGRALTPDTFIFEPHIPTRIA